MTNETLNYQEYSQPTKKEINRLLDGLLECYYKNVVALEDKAKYKYS